MPGARRSATYPREGVIVMPIRVGSRLEQLLALRRRVDVEIEQERRAEALRSPGRPDTGKTARVRPIGRVSSRADAHASLARLGVTPAQVREWGTTRGFELAIRGSLPIEVVEAYVAAHARAACEACGDPSAPGVVNLCTFHRYGPRP